MGEEDVLYWFLHVVYQLERDFSVIIIHTSQFISSFLFNRHLIVFRSHYSFQDIPHKIMEKKMMLKNIERRHTILQMWEKDMLSDGSVLCKEDKIKIIFPHSTNVEKVSMVSFNIDENASTFLDGLCSHEDKKANWRGSWISLQVPSVFTTVPESQFNYYLVLLAIIVLLVSIFVIIIVLYNVFVPFNQ